MALNRRSFVLAGSGIGAGFVGLNQMKNKTEETTTNPEFRISKIVLDNHGAEKHRFHLLITEQGTPAFWESPHVSAEGGTVWENPVSGPSNYRLYVRLDTDDEWKTVHFSSIEQCVDVVIDYGFSDGDSVSIAVSECDGQETP
jgi:hypothetical protein